MRNDRGGLELDGFFVSPLTVAESNMERNETVPLI